MSGVGKTHWSKKLEKKGFKRYCCDEIIEKKLKKYKGIKLKGIKSVAHWLGQPYEKHHQQNSKQYLSFEKEALLEIFNRLRQNLKPHEKAVIDTTGSVIYTGKDVMKTLSQLSKIIYLEIPNEVKKIMYKKYLQDPKPVIWGDKYQKTNGETDRKALVRCYQNLLNYRINKYHRHACLTLDYYLLRQPDFTIDKFIQAID